MQATKAWDEYWQHQSTTNSFASEYSDGDGPYAVVSMAWLDIFSDIQPSDSILDMGSGSGALLSLFNSQKQNSSFEKWINVDYAAVKPGANNPVNVEWLRSDFTNLDINDGSIDRVFSMFGFEYANPKKACNELLRVLHKGGEAVLMCHHPESVITAQSKISIAAFRALNNDKIFKLPNKLPRNDINQIRQHCLKRLMYQLNHNPQSHADDIKLLGNKIHQALHASNDPAQVVNFLSQVQSTLQMHSERLAQQVASSSNHHAIVKSFDAHNDCTLTDSIIEYSQQPIAYLVKVQKH